MHCLVFVRNAPEVFPAIDIPRTDTYPYVRPRGIFKMAITQFSQYDGRGWR